MKKILFLVSGGGGNLKFVKNYLDLVYKNKAQLYCISDRDCPALTYCESSNIENYKISYTRSSPDSLRDKLNLIQPDVIITNWHKIIDPTTVNLYRNKFINLHYSLLPSFGGFIGVEPINKAYENMCKFTGVTCHYVDEGVDTGEIISQAIFKTNMEIEYAYDKSFRAGCIILMDSILKAIALEGDNEVGMFENIIFSPEVNLNLNILDYSFWKNLKI